MNQTDTKPNIRIYLLLGNRLERAGLRLAEPLVREEPAQERPVCCTCDVCVLNIMHAWLHRHLLTFLHTPPPWQACADDDVHTLPLSLTYMRGS